MAFFDREDARTLMMGTSHFLTDLFRIYSAELGAQRGVFMGPDKDRITSNLVLHAEYELSLIEANDEMQQAMNKHILGMVRLFSEEGHSGFSASYAISLLQRLLRFEPIQPLTGDDSEWVDVCDEFFQNKRCSHVFKEKSTGRAYDIDGKIFRDPDGSCYTNSESRVYVEFPYQPVREYIDRIDRPECDKPSVSEDPLEEII